MIPLDPHLIVRAGSLYIALIATLAVWVWRRPDARSWAGATLAFCWNLTAVLLLHLAAVRAGWWSFKATGGLLYGMPVDLYVAWAWLWGAVPALGFGANALPVAVLAPLLLDVVLMPLGQPVIRLGPAWLFGELTGAAVGIVPGQLLARWTSRDTHLSARAALQVFAFSGLVLFVVPSAILDVTGGNTEEVVRGLVSRPSWQLSLVVQALALPTVLGLSAVQEFVTRGRGTPVPFDPPKRLVTSGPYAYVGNPMQIAGVTLVVLLGLIMQNVWIACAGVMAHVYAAGLAGWDEGQDLCERFGDRWIRYRRMVRFWLPRLRPRYLDDEPPARLYVAESCDMCREVAGWFGARDARHLTVLPAETHPTRSLTRITYQPSDGSRAESGIAALARAFEHLHLGWAMLGFTLRLPLVRPLVQLVADASGAGPRQIATASFTER